MADLRRIGLALQGFGAGVGGQSAQFNQQLAQQEQQRQQTALAQQQRSQQLSEGRKRSLALDFRETSDLLRSGFTDRAATAINNRLAIGSLLPGFNADTTGFIKTLIDTGQTEEALSFLDVIDRSAVDEGVIEARQQDRVIPASAISATGQIATQAPGGQISIQDIPGFRQAERGGLASAVTRTYGNGTVLQALPDGSTEVRNPAGETVTGAARLQTLADARQDELDFERTKSGAKAAGSQAIRVSGETFDRLGNIDIAIANFDDAIQAIDDGAATGPIMSRLPTFRAASVQLDNIQGRLGLDVIGNTTFGALSESELAFALNTALPQRLEPQELRQWLVEKRDAQSKLRNYLEDAAIFLGVEGNTVADWTAAQREIRSQRVTVQPTGGASTTLQFDAQGNLIQ